MYDTDIDDKWTSEWNFECTDCGLILDNEEINIADDGMIVCPACSDHDCHTGPESSCPCQKEGCEDE